MAARPQFLRFSDVAILWAVDFVCVSVVFVPHRGPDGAVALQVDVPVFENRYLYLLRDGEYFVDLLYKKCMGMENINDRANGNYHRDAYLAIIGGLGNTIGAAYQYAGVFGCNISAVASCTFHVHCVNACSTPIYPGAGSFPPGTVFICNSTYFGSGTVYPLSIVL